MFGPGGIGGSELLLILVIVLVIFGGKKIPELMGGIGKGVKEFKKGINGEPEKNEGEKKQVENKS